MNRKFITALELLTIVGLILYVLWLGGMFTPAPSPTPPNPATVTPAKTAPARVTATVPPTPTFPLRNTPTGFIAFESTRDGNSEIYTMDAAGSSLRNLTNNPANDYWPSWSPDGNQIAFFSLRTGWQEIYIMNADGSDLRQLTHTLGSGAAYQQPITWSPDGKIILAMRRDIWASHAPVNSILDAIDTHQASSQTLLGQTGPYSWYQTWPVNSPDVILLMQTKLDDSDCETYRGTLKGTLTNLRVVGHQCRWIAGSRNGQLLAYSDTNVRIINLDGQEVRRLDQTVQANGNLAWSPNDRYILYQSLAEPAYRVAYADGSGLLPVLIYSYGLLPSWAPDSAWLTYADSRSDGSSDICIINIFDRREFTQLTNTGNNYTPVWRPSLLP